MSDHIFNPKILCEILDYQMNYDECILCVDRHMRYVFDLEDATKVLVDKDRIIRIGKELKRYNGVDMGIFLCSPIIFSILGENIRDGRYTLTDAIMRLAQDGKMKAYCFDDEEYYWMDIDTFRMKEIAEKILPRLEAKSTFLSVDWREIR